MTDNTGRYIVVRNAFDYDVVDLLNHNDRKLRTRNRARAHKEADRLNREHREAQIAKCMR